MNSRSRIVFVFRLFPVAARNNSVDASVFSHSVAGPMKRQFRKSISSMDRDAARLECTWMVWPEPQADKS